MDSLARNALRLSLAGAGMAVLGAGFVGQASAAEAPDAPSAPGAPDTSLLTDNLPSSEDNDVTMDFGTDSQSTETQSTETQTTDAASTDAPFTDGLPSMDSLPSAGQAPSLDDLPPLEIPGAMFLEAPSVS